MYKKVGINYFFLLVLFGLYFIPSLYHGVLIVSSQVVEFEGNLYEVQLDPLVLFFYLLIFILLFFICVSFLYFDNKKDINISVKHWHVLSLVIIFICILNVFYSYLYSLNVAGQPNSRDISFWVKLSSLVFSPDYIVPMFLCTKFFSFKRYVFISLLFVIALLVRGWMGGFLILFFAWIINYGCNKEVWPKFTKQYFFAFLVCLMLCLPFLQFLKHYFREPGSDLLGGLSIFYSVPLISLYIEVFENVFIRFQAVDLLALLVDSLNDIKEIYDSGNIVPSWFDNIIFYQLGFWGEAKPYGQVFASYLKDENVLWATHNLAWGWFAVEGLPFLLYSAIILIVSYLIANKVGGLRFKYLLLFYVFIYYWHGWMSAFMNVPIYFMIYYFLVKSTRLVSRVRL